MAGAFLWDDKVKAAASVASIAGAPVSTLPVSNLVDAQPRLRARWLGSVAGVLVDLGAAAAIAGVALISTNLPAGATVRWRSGPTESLAEAAAVFDMRLTDPAAVVYPAGWTFIRPSAAWCYDSTGTLAQVAADTPRFDYDPVTRVCRGMLREEGRTNGIRNPRGEGAVAGTPGTNPTNWGAAGAVLTKSIVGVGTENGLPYVDVRWSGTAASSSNCTFFFETGTAIAALVGQAWTFAPYVRVAAGSTANVTTLSLTLAEHDSGGTALVTNSAAFTPGVISAALASSRQPYTVTLGNASAAFVRPGFRINFASGAVVDLTLRFGAVQCERGGQATSPMLPAIASPAATTRAGEQAYIAGLSIPSTGASLVVQGQCSAASGQVIVPAGMGPIDDFNNSIYFSADSTGLCTWTCLSGGVGGSPPPIGGTNNVPMTLAGGVSSLGAYFARNASTQAVVAGFVVAGNLDRVALGGAPWGNSAAVGLATGVSVYQRLALYGSRLLDTQIAALAATGSSLVPGALVYDSGVVAASPDAVRGNVVMVSPADVTARYLQVDVSAPGAALIDLGRLVAGPLWRPSRAMAYQFQEGLEVLDRRDRNPFTGAEFVVPALGNPRVIRFTLPLLTPAEIAGQFRAMLAAIGGAGDAVWIPDTGLSQAELNARSIFGAVAAPGGEATASRDYPGRGSIAFRIGERL